MGRGFVDPTYVTGRCRVFPALGIVIGINLERAHPGAEASEIVLNPFICVQPLQSEGVYPEQGQVQIATRRCSSRMVRVDRGLRPACLRNAEIGSGLSDSFWFYKLP